MDRGSPQFQDVCLGASLARKSGGSDVEEDAGFMGCGGCGSRATELCFMLLVENVAVDVLI